MTMTYQEQKLLSLFRSADDRARTDAINTLEAHQVQQSGKLIELKKQSSVKVKSQRTADGESTCFPCPKDK